MVVNGMSFFREAGGPTAFAARACVPVTINCIVTPIA